MATFEELTGLSVETAPEARPLTGIQQGTGADKRRAAGERAAELDEETGIGGTLGAAWERNIGPNIKDFVDRKWGHVPEEGFDPAVWVTENADSLSGQNLEKFKTVRSASEAAELRDDMARADLNDEKLAAKGYVGVAASLLTGLVDPAELAVAIGTAGYGKAATLTSRGARLAHSTSAGVKGALASATVAYTVDPMIDTQQLVYGALSGAVLSTGFAAAGTSFNASAQKTRLAYPAELRDLPDATIEPTEAPAYRDLMDFDAEPTIDQSGSMGAAKVQFVVKDAAMLPEGESRNIYEQSTRQMYDEDLSHRMVDTDMRTDTAAQRTAKRFSDVLATKLWAPLKTDFDRLMYSGSNIESALAYNLLESAEGRVRNNRSAAMLKENYETRISSQSLPILEDAYQGWAKKRNLGLVDRHKPSNRDAFDREVIRELEARYHEGTPVSGDPLIKQAADAVDANYVKALSIAKGRDGETSVSGFEDIQQKSGFFNHRWNGAAMRRAKNAGYTDEQMEAVIERGIATSNPDFDPDMTHVVAKAIIRRAYAKADGVDMNMLNTLDSDASTYLREMLEDSGVDTRVIDRLIDSIRGRKAEQGKMATTKKRVQMDLRTEVDGLSLIDLVDTNLTRTLTRYNREVSGNAALARKGIPDRTTRKAFIEAALAERRARGMPADEASRRYLENVFTLFDSGPIAGGVDPMVSRAKRLTNLSLLNQMAVTQAGETGAAMAAVGMGTWKKHADVVYKEMRNQGPEGPLAKELRPWSGDIGNEHMLFRDDLMMDELRSDVELDSFLGKLDMGLGKGQRLQGYVSGFYAVRSFQQKVATVSMADKIFQRIKAGGDENAITEALGLSVENLKRYVDNGMIEFDADGSVNKLNMEKWDAGDAEDFALGLARHTHQVVQKALAGEESMWMHSSVGSLFVHLKSFPLTAMRKQATRIANGQPPTAVATLLMTLATAGLAYEARQLINGRTDRISAEDAFKGALGMSNMTGWVPMLTDPVAQIVGLNDLRFNQYGRHDVNTGIIPLPPSIPTLNRMAQLPAAVNPLSDLSGNERIRIMQATPIVGNLYGFSALFNAMKD